MLNLLKSEIRDLVPKLEPLQFQYAEAKNQSMLIDKKLKLDECSELRDQVSLEQIQIFSDNQTWAHLSSDAFQTPYSEIRMILDQLNLQDRSFLVDLGCAYGRVAHVVGLFFPRLCFLGFEISHLRVEVANRSLERMNYSPTQICIQQQDIAQEEFELPSADAYFIYDFGSEKDIHLCLEKLRSLSLKKKFKVVARGRLIQHIIQNQHSWLSQVHPAQHFSSFSIYSNF